MYIRPNNSEETVSSDKISWQLLAGSRQLTTKNKYLPYLHRLSV